MYALMLIYSVIVRYYTSYVVDLKGLKGGLQPLVWEDVVVMRAVHSIKLLIWTANLKY